MAPDQQHPIQIQTHPELECVAFDSDFSEPLSEIPSPSWLSELLQLEAETPLDRSEELRLAVRHMLRVGGYKPAGRGKPASEYLLKAAGQGSLSSINLPVDICNVVSLHSGFPVSVIDLAKGIEPFEIRYGEENEEYIFNASGQVIRIGGLLCLCDGAGPCANAVKDAQRTKTDTTTTRTLSVVWGVRYFSEHLRETDTWYRSLIERTGGKTARVALTKA